MSHLLDDHGVLERTVALARAFGLPLHVMNREVDGSRTLQSAAEARGVISILSELGGGNRLSTGGLAIARKGIWNVMKYLGLTEGELAPFKAPTEIEALPDLESYGFAPAAGILCLLGASVRAGEPAAAIMRSSIRCAPACFGPCAARGASRSVMRPPWCGGWTSDDVGSVHTVGRRAYSTTSISNQVSSTAATFLVEPEVCGR